jgi:ribosomal protein S21
MSPNAALPAVPPEGPRNSAMKGAASPAVVPAKCIPPPADAAANRQKSRFNLAAINRYTAETATPSPNNTLNKYSNELGRIFPPQFINERYVIMPLDVSLYEGESQESLVRRFQKSIQIEGILREFRSSQTFLSKRDAFKIKSKRAARRKRVIR